MDAEHRDKVKEANRRRGDLYCRSRGAHGCKRVDGATLSAPGVFADVMYWRCATCGHLRPITRRQRKFKF